MISILILSPHWTLVQAWAASCARSSSLLPIQQLTADSERVPPALWLPAHEARNLLTRNRRLDSHVQFYLPLCFPLQTSRQTRQKGHSLPPASAQTRQRLGLFWWVGPFLIRKEGGKACSADGGTCCTWLDTLLGMSWASRYLLSILYFVLVRWRPPDVLHLQPVPAEWAKLEGSFGEILRYFWPATVAHTQILSFKYRQRKQPSFKRG